MVRDSFSTNDENRGGQDDPTSGHLPQPCDLKQLGFDSNHERLFMPSSRAFFFPRLLVIGFTTILIGCSSNGKDTPKVEDGLRNAVVEALVDDSSSGEALLKDLVDNTKAECVAANILNVDELRTSLQESFDKGVSGAELLNAIPDAGENPETQRLILNCLSVEDFVSVIASSMSSSDSTMSDEQRSCLIEKLSAIDKDDFVDGFIELQEGKTTGGAASNVAEALTNCLADATDQ